MLTVQILLCNNDCVKCEKESEVKIGNTHCRQSSNYRFIDCGCSESSHMFVNKANGYDTPDCDYGDANAMRSAAKRFVKSNKIDHSKRIFQATKSSGKWVFTSAS